MRKINLKFFLALMLFVAVLTGTVAGVHFFQRQRIAAALLWQAGRAEEQAQVDDLARYLMRYLEFNPHDLEAMERLGKALSSEHFAAVPRRRQRGLFLLDTVVTRQPARADLRLAVVRTALELRRPKMARDHLEILWKDATLPGVATSDKDRGVLEGLWGALLEAEGKADEARDWCKKAIAHNAQETDSYLRLAYLLRRANPSNVEKTTANVQEADRLIDQMVAGSPEPASSYLARWRYRREFDWLKENGTLSDARLAQSAKDVAAAAKRAPEALEVLLAEADLERLQAQLAAGDGSRNAAERERAVQTHRDRAYQSLQQGLRGLAHKGTHAANDPVQFQLLWHLGNLLLDDARAPDSPEGQLAEDEARQVIGQLTRAKGMPAAVDYLRARMSLRGRHWAEAAALFEQSRPLLSAQPDLVAQIDQYLGRCYEQLDEPGQMYAAYARVAAFDPNSTTAHLGMASAQWAMGRLDEASGQYRQVMAQGATPPRVWLDMARLEIRRQSQRDPKDWKEAESILDQAARALPDSLEPILLRAEILTARGELARAEELLTKARKEKPGRTETWTALALLTEKNKEQARGLALLADAEKELGDVVELRLARAHLLGSLGKAPVDKIIALSRGADRFKAEYQARLLGGLAEALFRANDYAGGRKLVQELADLPARQNDARLRLLLFDLAQRDGDETAMEGALAELTRVEGGESATTHYAQAMRQIGRAGKDAAGRKAALEEARVHLDRAASLRPSWPPIALARADVADLSGNPEQAIGHLKQAIDQGESNPRVIHRLVASLFRRQRYAEADQELRRLRQSLLMNSELGRWAAGIALRKGEQTRALELARDAVAEDSKDYREQIWLGQMLAAVRAPTEAEQKLRRAVALAPAEPAPWVALVQFLAGQKQVKAAREAIAQAEAQVGAERAELALAQAYEAIGDLPAATRHYAAALEKQGTDVTVVRTVAAYHLRAGRLQEAAPLLERIVAGTLKTTHGDLDWAKRGLAIVLAAGSDYQRFRRALELVDLKLDDKGQLVRDNGTDNDSSDVQWARAHVLATQGQRQFRDRAIALLEGLARRQALTADDRFVLALLYEAAGADAKAHEQLRDLVLDQVQSPFYLIQFTLTLLRQGDLDQAATWIARLEKLERQQEKPAGTYGTVELRARLLEARGEGNKAVALLEAHAGRAGAVPEEQLLVAASLGRQKRFAEALALCAKAWGRCTPETVSGASIALLQSMQATDDQYREVENLLRGALEAATGQGKPPRPILLLNLAALCDQRGQYADAEALYRRVLQVEARNFVALNNLAWLIVQRAGNAGEALPMIETAVNVIGRRADLLDTRGLVFLALGKMDQAVADLKESTADAPTPTRLFHLAQALHQAHDRDGAVKALKEAKGLGLQAAKLHAVEQQACRKLLLELKVQ